MIESEQRDPLTYSIIGAAMEVHRVLGPGLLESLYEDAFSYELGERSLYHERQKRIQVDYKGRDIGNLVADVIVENRVIVELKAVDQLAPIHTTQPYNVSEGDEFEARIADQFQRPRTERRRHQRIRSINYSFSVLSLSSVLRLICRSRG